MGDNTILNPGVGGDTIRDINRAGVKTQVVALDAGGETGPESLISSTNGLPVQPATGATFSVTGTFWPATQPVSWSGQAVAATQSGSWTVGLAAGSNTIGGVTQSGGPWSVSWSGQAVAATQSGTWNVGSVASLPALAAGSNTIGAVTQAGGPWTINYTQIAGATLGAATAWGVAPSGNVQGVNANVLALPALSAGSNVVGGVTQAGGPWSVSWSAQSVAATQSGTWNVVSVAAASSNYAPSQVSVAATATSLIAARGGGRNAVIITNMSTTPVFLGGSGVTAATGGYLAGIVGAAKVLPYNGAIYGITATGTASVSVEEIY